jgi:hypothetical protein
MSVLPLSELHMWGPLAPKRELSPCATCGIINWALQHVARFSPVGELDTCTTCENLFIDSAVVAHEVRRFESAESYQPDGKFMRKCNLVFLRERLRSLKAQSFADVAELEVVVLPLNTNNLHWSILLYYCKTNEFLHLDSVDKLNDSVALSASKLLTVLNFVPRGASFWTRVVPVQQKSVWECGYAALVQAFFFSGVLATFMPQCTDPREIIQNTALLKQFIRELLQRSRLARQVNAFASSRLDNIYNSQ